MALDGQNYEKPRFGIVQQAHSEQVNAAKQQEEVQQEEALFDEEQNSVQIAAQNSFALTADSL